MGTELSLFAVCIMILGVCSQDEGELLINYYLMSFVLCSTS